MRQLFIMRHGEAGFDAASDQLRTLTARGIQDSRQMLADNRALMAGVCIYASPYLRAQQTAGLAAEALSNGEGVQTCDLLVPESDPQQVLAWLETLPEGPIMLVAHQPLVGRLIGLLVDGDLRRAYPMGTSSLAALESDVIAAGCFTQSWIRHCR